MNIFKKGFVLLAASVIFCACGDDSSTSSSFEPESSSSSEESSSSVKKESSSKKVSSSSEKVSSSSKKVSSSSEKVSSSSKNISSSSEKVTIPLVDDPSLDKIKVDIDESAQTVIEKIVEIQNYCVTDENRKTFSMKSVELGSFYSSFRYEFREDTLVRYGCGMGESKEEIAFDYCSSVGFEFVGGKENIIYGSWKYTGCNWYADEKKVLCGELPEAPADKSMIVGDGVIAVPKNSSSYQNIYLGDSYYVNRLHDYLLGSGTFPEVKDLFVQNSNNDVYIMEGYQDSVKFSLGGIDFMVEQGEYVGNKNKLSVTADNLVCTLEYVVYNETDFTDEICNAGNVDYFLYAEYGVDGDDLLRNRVSLYVRGDESEFKDCIDEIKKKVKDEESDGDAENDG